MCCFTGPVNEVRDTSIFARHSSLGAQLLVYDMRFGAAEDLAMVLPLPVPTPATEDAVRFINLSGCPDFFTEMERGFPPRPRDVTVGFTLSVGGPARTLQVHSVGSFDASFVPTLHDFARLDARFRLPHAVWAAFPRHGDYGFAVFRLRSTGKRSAKVHPMAFEFSRRDPSALFFPTVHIHDGRYGPTANFDHHLYVQFREDPGRDLEPGFEVSNGPARGFMKAGCLGGIVNAESHIFRHPLEGSYRNADVFIRRGQRGQLELRLGESPDPGARVTDATAFASSLVAEILLHRRVEVEAGRRNGDVYTRLADDIRLARETWLRRAPAGLTNAGPIFETALEELSRSDLSSRRR